MGISMSSRLTIGQGLFQKNYYRPIDFIRKKIWNKKEIDPYYVQNILLFVKDDSSIFQSSTAQIVLSRGESAIDGSPEVMERICRLEECPDEEAYPDTFQLL